MKEHLAHRPTQAAQPVSSPTGSGSAAHRGAATGALLSTAELLRRLQAASERGPVLHAKLQQLWAAPERGDWAWLCVDGMATVARDGYQSHHGPELAVRLRRTVLLLVLLTDALTVTVACLDQLQEHDALALVPEGGAALFTFRSALAQDAALLAALKHTLLLERVTAGSGACAVAEAVFNAALIEIARRRHYGPSADYTRARTLLAEAHALGHSEAAACAGNLPAR